MLGRLEGWLGQQLRWETQVRVYGCGGVENSFELHWFEWFLRQPSGDILAAAEDAMRGVGNGEEWMDTKG